MEAGELALVTKDVLQFLQFLPLVPARPHTPPPPPHRPPASLRFVLPYVPYWPKCGCPGPVFLSPFPSSSP